MFSSISVTSIFGWDKSNSTIGALPRAAARCRAVLSNFINANSIKY